jgi:hypothetical protein
LLKYHVSMTNLMLVPLHRSFTLSRRVATSAVRVSGAMLAPVTGPVSQLTSTAKATLRLAPTLMMGAYEQVGELVPRSLAQQLPARVADVDSLEARVARLEAAALERRTTKSAATPRAAKSAATPRAAKSAATPRSPR